MDLYMNAEDCNCGTRSTTNKGMKGTTIWKSLENPIYIAPNSPYTISFTDTRPKCIGSTDADVCLLTYKVQTTGDSQEYSAVKIRETLNNASFGPIFHSKIQWHDITETVDISQVKNAYGQFVYGTVDPNQIVFHNDSDVGVYLYNLRIFRAYAMASLDDEYLYGCSGPSSVGSNGNLDNTREDYPCNYDSYGKRLSFSHCGGYNSSQNNGEIPAGNEMSWTIHNAPSANPSNYDSPNACFFNLNNVTYSGNPPGDDIHYAIKLNNEIIEHFYLPSRDQDGNPREAHQAAGVDLTQWGALYNDGPEESNILAIYNMESSITLKLIDGSPEEPGRVDIYEFYRVANLCQDSFDDSVISERIWDTISVNGGQVNLNGQLQVVVPSGGSGWCQAGKVSKYAHNTQAEYGFTQQGMEAKIDITGLNNLEEMNLMISPDKMTTTDPWSSNNLYRIRKCFTCGSAVSIQRRLNGSYESKYQSAWASPTGQLKIKVSTGSIAFYENGILKYAEPYALPSNNCYIYVYTSSSRPTYTGTGTFDNYSLIPAEIFRDDFKDGNYNGWTVDSGNWQVTNGQLRSTTNSSHIHYYTTFSANRHVTAKIQTLTTAGGSSWFVPWLYVKEQDGNNNVYALIHTNGYVELCMFYLGRQYILGQTYVPGLSPYLPHVLAVSIIGTNGKVWVDGVLRIDATDSNLANLAGYVGLYTPSSTGTFDDVAVFSE